MPCTPSQHIPCHVRKAIPYTMLCFPGYTMYHARHTKPYHIHAIPDTPYQMPCPPNITIYNAMSTRLYHIPHHAPCDARNAIPYTMPWPPGHTIYHAVARQAIAYTMSIPPGHTTYLAMHARPNHAMPVRLYHVQCHVHQAIPHTMTLPARSYDKLCHFRPGHTIYHVMPDRPYTIYHTMSARPYHMPVRP